MKNGHCVCFSSEKGDSLDRIPLTACQAGGSACQGHIVELCQGEGMREVIKTHNAQTNY